MFYVTIDVTKKRRAQSFCYMPKVTKPLTNTEINNARGKAKEYNLADGLGLALRVRPGGDKYWIFNYQRPITKVRANNSGALGEHYETPRIRKCCSCSYACCGWHLR